MEIKEIFQFRGRVRPIVWYWRVLLAIWMILFIPLLFKLPPHMVFSINLIWARIAPNPSFLSPLLMMIVFMFWSPKSEWWTSCWRFNISLVFFVVYLTISDMSSSLVNPQESYLKAGTLVDQITYEGETGKERSGPVGMSRGKPIVREVVVVADPLDWGGSTFSSALTGGRMVQIREPNSNDGQLQRNLNGDTSLKMVPRSTLFTKDRY